MELREALAEIADIRIRIAESEVFRGYRAVPVALSGVLAIAAAIVQTVLIPKPTDAPVTYVLLWISVAGLSVLAAAIAMLLKDRYGGVSQTREVTLFAISQLAPSLIAGALITAVIVRVSPESTVLLPGLWQVFFSLGLFASCRLLPRAIAFVAFFYLLTGIGVMFFCRDDYALHPWAMGLPFGIGELAAASILYWNLERSHEKS